MQYVRKFLPTAAKPTSWFQNSSCLSWKERYLLLLSALLSLWVRLGWFYHPQLIDAVLLGSNNWSLKFAKVQKAVKPVFHQPSILVWYSIDMWSMNFPFFDVHWCDDIGNGAGGYSMFFVQLDILCLTDSMEQEFTFMWGAYLFSS